MTLKEENSMRLPKITFTGTIKIIKCLSKCCRLVGELHRVPNKLIIHH